MNKAPSKTRQFSDIDLDFLPHPVTKDLVIKTNEEAIKRSVRNLVRTNFFERKFHSEIGTKIPGLLFDNISPITAISLKNEIRNVIINFEPRINILDLLVLPNPDKNSFEVTLIFLIINTDNPVTINFFLEKTR